MGYFFDASKKLFSDTRNGMKQVIAEWNPEFATELEIEQMEKEFDKINVEVTRAKSEMAREVAQYKVKKAKYDQMLAAAQILQSQGKDEKAMLQMDKAEAYYASEEIDREKEEADEATAYFNEMQAELNDFGKKITQAKSQIDAKRRGAQAAKVKAERENRKVENARVLAGLKAKTAGLDSLGSIYDKQREQHESKADEAKRKVEILKGSVAPVEEEDPDIAAAMAVAGGAAPRPVAESFEEKMARLKSKVS